MTKKMTIQEVIEYIENKDTNDDFAFRGDDYIPARKFRNSFYHPSDIDDGETYNLGGVSSIKVMASSEKYIIEAANLARPYGSNLFLLQGTAINAVEENHDKDECLMIEHKIICIVA